MLVEAQTSLTEKESILEESKKTLANAQADYDEILKLIEPLRNSRSGICSGCKSRKRTAGEAG